MADGPVAPANPPFYLWPEHVPAVELWLAVQTEWRTDMGTRTGLCYASIRARPVFRRMAPRRRERALAGVAVMERAALDAWAEQRDG